MSCHETVSSDVPGSKDRSQTAAAGTDPNTPVSSELSAAAGQEADGDWVEDGWMMEMYGGGTLESVPDFDPARAMIEGFDPKVVEVDAQFSNLPRSCDLEYATPETVCGRDDRVRITSTTRIPWRAICQLIITGQSGGTSRCTGWFIGPRTVMTAGHCVYSHGGGGWAKKIEVIPGMDAASRPFGSQTGNSFRSVSAWTTGANPEYDYGAIILPDNSLGNKVGWFGFAALSDATLNQMLVNNAGYAGDKPFGTLWYNAGRITRLTPRKLFYMLDTYGGHSGSAVWRAQGPKRHAVGVHAYGGCPNSATRINREVFENMRRWKALGS